MDLLLATSNEHKATAVQSLLGYYDGRDFVSFLGVTKGVIARTPRGSSGYGWDPIFIPQGWTKTFAEMTPEEAANFVSMRTKAVSKLKVFLDGRINDISSARPEKTN